MKTLCSLTMLSALTVGCVGAGVDEGSPQNSAQALVAMGTVHIPLVTRVNEVTYRLSAERMVLRGPVTRSVPLEGDGPSVNLPPGTYRASLVGAVSVTSSAEGGAPLRDPAPFGDVLVQVVAGQSSMLSLRVDVVARAMGSARALTAAERAGLSQHAGGIGRTTCEIALVKVDLASEKVEQLTTDTCIDPALPQAVSDFRDAWSDALRVCGRDQGGVTTWQYDLAMLWPERAADACPALGLGGDDVTLDTHPTHAANYTPPVRSACEVALDRYARLATVLNDRGSGACLDPTIGDLEAELAAQTVAINNSCQGTTGWESRLTGLIPAETLARCDSLGTILLRCPPVWIYVNVERRAAFFYKRDTVRIVNHMCSTEFDATRCEAAVYHYYFHSERSGFSKYVDIDIEQCPWPAN